MSFETVQAYFERFGMADRCMDLKESSATVALAALALGTEEACIAKTLSFLVGEVPVVIVTAGDARIDNHKYKMLFHKKPKMMDLFGKSDIKALYGLELNLLEDNPRILYNY